MSINFTTRNVKKDTQLLQEDQKSIEKLKFLLKNAIQINEELEKKNSLLQYRLEQQVNSSQNSIQQEDLKLQIEKLQQQLQQMQNENSQLQQSLRTMKISGAQNQSQRKNTFEIILQDCKISKIEKEFYEYFEKQTNIVQEQIILEFQNLLEKCQTRFQIVEINKITSFSNLDKIKCIENQQKEIDELEQKLVNMENELHEYKKMVEQNQIIRQNQPEQVQDFFSSNQFEVFTSRINNSQGIDECLSTEKRWIDLENNENKSEDSKLKQYQQKLEEQNEQIEKLQNQIFKLTQKKQQLKLQNNELSTVLYQQAETCQRIIQSLQQKIEKQKAQIIYFQNMQIMRQKSTQLSSQHSVQSSSQMETRKKFTYHSPNTNNSPVSLAKIQNNSRTFKKQDSSNDQTSWLLKTTDASLVRKPDKKDSQSESIAENFQKPTKLTSSLLEVKKSLDQMSNLISNSKIIKGYFYTQAKPIITLEDLFGDKN